MSDNVRKTPRVSVVVPVYCHTDDHAIFLAEALQSVAEQTYRDFEVVIVDDVSPRDILPLVDSVEGLPEIRVLRNVMNVRQAESRNVGIRACRGELIAFLDHDDLWMPDKLARQVEALDANPDAVMVFCDMIMFGMSVDWLKINQEIIPERPEFYWFVAHGNFVISASAVLVRKQAMLDIGLFDSRYSTCDDFDAWLKLLMSSPIIHLAGKLAKYRLHAYNANYTVDRLNDNVLLTALIWRYWRQASTMDKIRLLPRLGRKYLGRIYFTVRRFRKFKGGR
ncbi:MAG: glycosyltransferase [Armatimonadota bacterium]|nr:glycosyltransferase [bacterium]